VTIAAELRVPGKARMVIGDQCRAEINLNLVRLMQEAFAAKTQLLADTNESINAITARLAKSKGRMTSLMRLSYLAPQIVNDLVRAATCGLARALAALSKELPLDWAASARFYTSIELPRRKSAQQSAPPAPKVAQRH
jgi:hypothetical protein